MRHATFFEPVCSVDAWAAATTAWCASSAEKGRTVAILPCAQAYLRSSSTIVFHENVALGKLSTAFAETAGFASVATT